DVPAAGRDAAGLPDQLRRAGDRVDRGRGAAWRAQAADADRRGGVGKTPPALPVAGGPHAGRPARGWVVAPPPLAPPALLHRAALAALDLREARGQTPLAALTDALRGRRALLLLDNCEHLVAACAELAEHLLRVCPHLSLLATSRELLGVPGEAAWQV